jgi:hypothetical protein
MAAYHCINKQLMYLMLVGFMPVSVDTQQAIWGTKENVTMEVTYVRDFRATKSLTTLFGVWADKDNLWDLKTAAIQVDAAHLPKFIPPRVQAFTRVFKCLTYDRLVPNERSYIYIKVRDERVHVNIMSERFTTTDNRITAGASGAFFWVTCKFEQDKYNETLPIREESRYYSDILPPLP